MKNPKVGDRVAKYNNDNVRYTGFITRICKDNDGICEVDFTTHHEYVHRTHLIRLKPKKKREKVEYETHINNSMGFEFQSKFEGRIFGEKIKVTVEVLP